MPERIEKEQIPPPRVPVAEYQTPAPSVVFFSETANKLDPAYPGPPARGTLYSTVKGADPTVIAAYPTLYFVKESRLGNSDQWVVWTWSTVPNCEDTYNAEIDYVAQSTAAPRFSRVYTLRRDDYEKLPTIANGSPLSGVTAILVQDGGVGYQPSDPVLFTGGGGTGLQAQLVVDGNGTILSIIILSEGIGFTAAPTITIDTFSGEGAIISASIQPQTAVLVSQKKEEFPENHPLRNEFVRIIRVYETLPGPFITTYRTDDDGVRIKVQRRHNLQSTIDAITPSEFITNQVWFRLSSEPVDESSFVCWEVQESRPVPGNIVPSAVVEADNVIKFESTILADSTTIVPSVSQAGGIITKVDQTAVSNVVSKQVTSTKAIFDEAKYAIKIPITIPEKFRAVTPIRTIRHVLAGTAAMPVLGAGEFERENDQLAVFVESQSVTSIDTTTLPVSLTEYKMTQYGEIETIIETLANGLQTISPNVLTLEAEVDNLGANLSLQIVGTVPSLFTRPSFKIARPDLLPEKFRAEVPITTTILDVAGTASLPTLATGEFEKTQEQLTLFKYRQTTVARASVALPVSISSTKMTAKGQVESIVETLNTGFQTFTPNDLFIEASVEDLGDGTSLMTVGTVPTLFTEPAFTSKIPDVVPERFRVAIPTQTTEQLVNGTASMPVLAPGQLEASQSQETEFVYRSKVTARAAVALPVTLVSYKYSKDKQVITVVETYAAGLQTITPAALLVEAEVLNTGDGNSLLTQGTVSSLFTRPSYSVQIPDPIPEKFRVVAPVTVTEIDSIGTASQPTLGTGDLEITKTQVDEFILRTTTKSRSSVVLPVSLISYKMTKDKQVATVTETLATGLQTITPDVLTTEAEVINLGNNTSLLVQGEVVSLFTGKSSARIIPDLVPEKFRATIPVFETELLVAGTIVDPPIFSTGDIEKIERQVDALTKSVRLKTRGGVALPVTYISTGITPKFGGTIYAEIATLNTSGSMVVDQGLMVLSSEITPLGNGMDLKVTQQAQTDVAWPILLSTHVDETYGLIIDISKQVVAAGATGGVAGGIYTEVKSIDKWRSISIASKLDPAGLPADVQWLSSKRHSFPPELINAVIDWAEAVGGCSLSFSATLIANFFQYTGVCQTRITEQFFNGPPPNNVTLVQFCPQSHNFGFAWFAACTDSSSNPHTKSGAPSFHIPLCLHGQLSLSIGSIVWNFPPTTPASLPHGTYIIIDAPVERWRLGVFRRNIVEVFVPVCGGGGGGFNVLKADASSADAYLQKDLGSDQTVVWVTFELGFFAAALNVWQSGTYSGDFTELLTLSAHLAGLDISGSFGLPQWEVGLPAASSQTPAPVASKWQTVEMQFTDNGTTRGFNLYINGTLSISNSAAGDTSRSRLFRVGLSHGAANFTNNQAYIRSVQVGTKRGASDLFSDDFSSGDFSKWDSAVGAVSIVPAPF